MSPDWPGLDLGIMECCLACSYILLPHHSSCATLCCYVHADHSIGLTLLALPADLALEPWRWTQLIHGNVDVTLLLVLMR